MNINFTYLPGDGIGPEVGEAAMAVLNATAEQFGHTLDAEFHLVGGAAIDARSTPLPDDTFASCEKTGAILLGAVGGPKWDHLKGADRPELGSLLPLRKNLNLYANIGLLETKFDDYINADGADLSGRDQAHAPSYQFAVGGRYDFSGGFYLRADIEGKDDYFFSDRHSVKSPSQDLLSMRAGYSAGGWDLALWGRNLTDEDYFVRGFGSFGNDPRKEYITEPYFQYGEPRMVGVSAAYTF